jgi:iron complex outermembrane receptor protein
MSGAAPMDVPAPSAEVAEAAEEVRVVGAREGAHERSPSRATVDRERLAQPGMRLGEALRVVPGIAVRDAGAYGAFASVALRGATAAQTPVYFGSVLLNDDVAGTADLSAFSPALLERVDVHRGHAPIDRDRQGLAGAVVLVPRAIGDEALLEGAVTAGTLGHAAAQSVGGVRHEAGSVLALVLHERATNRYAYVDDRGTAFDATDDRRLLRANADFQATSALVSGDTALAGVRMRAFAIATTREQGVPRLALLPSVAARLAQERELAAIDAETALGGRTKLLVRATGTWARSDYADPLGELGLGSANLALRGRRLDQRVAVDHRGEGVRIFAAIGAVEESLDRVGGAALAASRFTGRSQAGAVWELAESVSVEGAASYELQREDASGTFTAGARDAHVASGRLVVRFHERGFEALAVAARYARAPTLGERFGVDGATRGNDELRPESGVAGDLVLRGTFGEGDRVRAELVGFARSMTDLIDYTKTSPGTVKPINVGSARILGMEAAADARAFDDVRAGLAVTLLDATDTTPSSTLVNRDLPFRARHVESAFVRVAPGFGARRDLRFEWRTNVEGPRTVDPAGLARIPAQAWSDASLRGRLEHVELAIRFGNVFDQARVDIVGYPLPGRTVDLTLGGSL